MDDGSDKFASLTPDEMVAAPGDATRAPHGGEPVSPVPANAPPPPTRHFTHGEPTATWIYRDANGAELCRILRFDFPDRRKDFYPLTLWRKAGANQSCAIKRRGVVIRLVGYDLRDGEGWWRARPNSPPNRR